MPLNQAGASKNSAAFANDQLDFLLTVPANACLHRFEVHGILNLPATAPGLGTGDFDSFAFVSGLQYGASGYGGVHLTSGNTVGATWLTWSEPMPGWRDRSLLAGASRIAAVELDAQPINLSWRGTLFIPSALDYYFATGCNPAQLFAHGQNYTWYCEYST